MWYSMWQHGVVKCSEANVNTFFVVAGWQLWSDGGLVRVWGVWFAVILVLQFWAGFPQSSLAHPTLRTHDISALFCNSKLWEYFSSKTRTWRLIYLPRKHNHIWSWNNTINNYHCLLLCLTYTHTNCLLNSHYSRDAQSLIKQYIIR